MKAPRQLSFIVLTSVYSEAQRAVLYADELAGGVGAHLLLLHANHGSFCDPHIFTGESWRPQELADAPGIKARLTQLAGQLRAPATVALLPHLLPAAARALTRQHRPALVVVERPAADAAPPDQVSLMLLELLRAVQLPLLLVPHTTAPAPPQRVLIAADSEPFALPPAIDGVKRLLHQLAPHVTIVHISGTEADENYARAKHAVELSGLTTGLPDVASRGYQYARPADGILAAIHDVGADLVLLLARPRSYLGEVFPHSVTAEVLRRSPVPVLIVPAAESTAAPRHEAHHAADNILV
ncbi:universal stress protein [Hymenobacter siberiensis]|uniref:universal stress protein n=1 Tax=Hymenobacter siberiensis TaxID=2848396 RepID=UPI001C1E237E|nr:universal stress protein [Hymenobacter siberiensis]